MQREEGGEATPWPAGRLASGFLEVRGGLRQDRRSKSALCMIQDGILSFRVEGLPWVPDRPTLGSRFFSGLCQVPVNKMVSGGFPRVFRFPQLLL